MIALEPWLAAVPARTAVCYQPLEGGPAVTALAEADFPAASVIKVPILLELYRQAAAGQLTVDETVRLASDHKVGGAGVLLEMHDGLELTLEDLGRLMLVVSDNTASNLLLDRLGLEAINASMQRWGMPASRLGRRFMEPATPGRDNRLTASDAARCLAGLYHGEILPEPWRGRALDILRRQQYREKIPLMLPPDVSVAHKTGELDGVRHDAAIVEVPGRPYVLVLLTERGGEPWLVDRALAELSLAVYRAHLESGS